MVVEAGQLRGFVDEAEQLGWHINDLGIHDLKHLSEAHHSCFQQVDGVAGIALEFDELFGLHIVVLAEKMQKFEHVTEDLEDILFFLDLLVSVRFIHVLSDHSILA